MVVARKTARKRTVLTVRNCEESAVEEGKWSQHKEGNRVELLSDGDEGFIYCVLSGIHP
jgi:precorrin-3B methylase